MHFITFPVASTNIFPLSNSTQGGQLVTEFNLKSRDMVLTNPNIKYAVGPSFIHSLDDFKIKLLEDSDVDEYNAENIYSKGDYCSYNDTTYICIVDIVEPEEWNPEHWVQTAISTSILQIGPGRAVVNGHYVETLAPMQIDLNLANAELKQQSQAELYGSLSIGIKTYFSTENTMSGAMLVENTDNMYVGVQLVVTQASEFKTPNDCPNETERDDVTADIKLADFTYINGVISKSSITPNENATRFISSERIYDFDSILDSKYVTSDNLVDREFYAFSGETKKWCDSTGNLMVWDAHSSQNWKTLDPEDMPQEWKDKNYPIYWATAEEAGFLQDTKGNVKLIVPHKQPHGPILNDADVAQIYYPKVLEFPTASYSDDTSGIVTGEYTKKIKEIGNVINTYKQFTNGRQIMYLDTLTADSEGNLSYEFPKDLRNFNVGDYILVREDYTVSTSEDEGAAPSTMYFVLPGGVTSIEWAGTTQPSGIRLGIPQSLWEGDGAAEPTETVPDAAALREMFVYDSYQGSIGDYFEIIYHNLDDTVQTSYYYPVNAAGDKLWSDAVMLTGGVPLATEDQVGGFYNATTDSEYTDAGYVYLDETGHLRLMDYALLRSGALAYQLGSSFSVPANQTLEYVQADLNEHVNERVAFYTGAVLTDTPQVIDVNIPLPEDEEGIINIFNIDSRFGTAVYLHFIADKTKNYSGIVINISDCEKIRIDSSITTLESNGPVINIFRSCLYYDAPLFNYIRTCDWNGTRAEMFASNPNFTGFSDLTLWYARFRQSDPNLIVNGMEVSQPNVAMATQDISFWDENISHDNHYSYALRSITMSGSGQIIGVSMYVSNGSTYQSVDPSGIDTIKHTIIGGDFVIPQGSALNYPIACINNPISVTGTFTAAYMGTGGADWIVCDTSFTAKTGVYSTTQGMQNGSIAFNSQAYKVPAIYTHTDSIGSWAPGSYHIFYGGTTV